MNNKKLAVMAGLGYLVIFVTGIYANFMVLEPVKALLQDASLTDYLQENSSMFRKATMSFVLMVLADLLLTWCLYELTKVKFPRKAMLAAFLRLANVAIFGVALKDLMMVSQLISTTGMEAELQRQLIAQSLQSFDFTWLCGLLFFGFHLMVLGDMLVKGKSFIRIVGSLLLIAGLGYLVDSIAHIILPNYADYADIFSLMVILPGIVGELSLTIWLLIQGFKKQTFNF